MTQSKSSAPLARVARAFPAIVVVSLLALGVAASDNRQRSSSERDASRQTVQPGQAASSRREPSRLRNEDEPAPTVQNRAPEVIGPRPTPVPAPASIPPNRGG